MKETTRCLPMSLRNKNPLNIRKVQGTHWKGEVQCRGKGGKGAFVCFESMEWGIRAAFCILRSYARKHNLHCVRDIIRRWAPPTENETAQYIINVCRWTGFGALQRLTEADWPQLVQAMARQESGITLSQVTIAIAFELYKYYK